MTLAEILKSMPVISGEVTAIDEDGLLCDIEAVDRASYDRVCEVAREQETLIKNLRQKFHWMAFDSKLRNGEEFAQVAKGATIEVDQLHERIAAIAKGGQRE